MLKTKLAALLLMGMVALMGQVKAQQIRPSLTTIGVPGTDNISFHFTAGSDPAPYGFTVFWNTLNLPFATCAFNTIGPSSGYQCGMYALQAGQSVDFTIDPTLGSSGCQVYPPNTDGLMCGTTYRFFARLNGSNIQSNNAFQSTAPCP